MTILLIILVNTPFILTGITAQPPKILIGIDISGPKPMRVCTIRSEAYPGGTNYSVKKASMGSYVIGMVRDGDEIIIEGDPTAMSRYVLVHPREDGMMYVRVITRWRNADNSFRSRIVEFRRGPIDLYYMQIFRVPIEVDVAKQETDHMIQVEETDTGTVRFTIQPEMALHAVIGAVKYNGRVLEDKVNGLMERKVTLESRLRIKKPVAIITSKYNDGAEFVSSYTTDMDVEFPLRWTRKKSRFFNERSVAE